CDEQPALDLACPRLFKKPEFTMSKLSIGVSERRARLARRHGLSPSHRLEDVVSVAKSLVGLHATDPAAVYLSAWARTGSLTVSDVDRALYDDRALVRMLAMRRTMFVVPVEDVDVVDAAASRALVPIERRRNRRLVEMLGVENVRAW